MSDGRELRLDACMTPATVLALSIVSGGPSSASELAHQTDGTAANSQALLLRNLAHGRVALIGNGHAEPLFELTPIGRWQLDQHFQAMDAMRAMIKPPRMET
jgi:hypothetical protein